MLFFCVVCLTGQFYYKFHLVYFVLTAANHLLIYSVRNEICTAKTFFLNNRMIYI